MHMKEWPMKASLKRERKHHITCTSARNGALNARCAKTRRPENKATAFLITHCERSGACRKPGTAFTMEYHIPGTDVMTLVVQATGNDMCSLERDHSVLAFLEHTLRSERTLQSTSCKPSSFYDAPI
eukprot:5892563-Amphidinium_carterae.1